MPAPELPPEPTTSTITTLFCDGETRNLSFRRRNLGIKFYAMRLAQAVLGQVYPVRAGSEPTAHDQHLTLVTLVEKESQSQEVVRTINSGIFHCEHM